MSFAEAIKQAEKEGQVGTGVWKPTEGANRIRVVAGPLPDPSEYTDPKTKKTEKRFKWLTLIIERKDGTLRPYFMPHSVAKMIRNLQQSEDYAFEGMPMPYDITLTAAGAGTRDVEYGVQAARTNTPLTTEELNKIDEFGPLADFQKKLREKRGEGHFDPEDEKSIPL